MERKSEILSFESLLIGFSTGSRKKVILPPLKAQSYMGELIAVVGQNGVGKSTLLRTISGLQKPLGGKILLKKKELSGYSRNELAQNIGYISTEPVKVSNMTVNDLVSLGRFPHTNWVGKLTSEDIEVITDSIAKVGMLDFVNRNITELSDGERQRAMVARVLAQDTNLLIMDEPTAFLDIKSKYEIIHLLHELSRKRGKTVIFSTHDLNVAMGESDKIWLILDDVFFEGAPEDLILEGAFDRLFSNSLVRFNNTDGNFTFRSLISGRVKVKGDGNTRIWTEKAINRAGYSVSAEDSHIEVEVSCNEGRLKWNVSTPDRNEVFFKLYDLVNWLVSKR